MGGVVKTIGKIAAVVAVVAKFIPGIGSVVSVVASAVAIGAGLLAKKPKAPQTSPSAADRLTASLDPRAPRKIVLGRTAMATDIRDQELTGNQEYLHRFIVCASHAVEAIEEIWFDDKLAWSASGGVASEFAGYLTVTTRTEGSAGNAINISARMGSSRRFTGLAYVHLRYKLTGNSKKQESPFSQSIASRVTIIGKGAKVYDPRLDSTVPGGSGSQRANDQSTWAYSVSGSDGGRNQALQTLWYMLGWKINGKIAVGKGVPAERIDLPSFITAANLCDELVAKAAGGTEPRYRSDGIFSEADDPTVVLDNLKASMNADLDDQDGLIRVTVYHNDLATPIDSFNDDDVLGAFTWQQAQPLNQSFNIIRGTYTDATPQSLYQMVDYPAVVLTSPDGIDRIETIDFPLVQSPSQAQRLAKQRLQRAQYGGMFSAEFQATAWKVLKGDVIALTFGALGWTEKLFRVVSTEVRVDGVVPMTLREEHPDIYLWDAEESPAVQAADPTTYDHLLDPIKLALGEIEAEISEGLFNGFKVWTQPSAPTYAESAPGQYWRDSDDSYKTYIRVTGPLTAGGVTLTANGVELTASWSLVDDPRIEQAINNAAAAQASATAASAKADEALDRLDDIDDDGVLTASEKIQRLIPDAAVLENTWDTLDGLATWIASGGADVATQQAAAAAARTAWLAFLAGLSPPWNDTETNTPVARGSMDAVLEAYNVALDALDAQIKAESSQSAIWDRVDGSLKPEDLATRNIELIFDVPDLTIAFDYTGTAKSGALPKTFKATVMRGVNDVTADATLSATPTNVTVSGVTASGVVTITGISADGWVDIEFDYSGVVATRRFPVYYAQDPAPPPGPSSVSKSSGWSYVSSTSYGGTPVSIGTITADANGDLKFTLGLTYQAPAPVTLGTNTFKLVGKAAYKPTAGSWTDVAAETGGSTSQGRRYEIAPGEPEVSTTPGALYINVNLTTLTPGQSVEVGFFLRKDAGSSIAGETPWGISTVEHLA